MFLEPHVSEQQGGSCLSPHNCRGLRVACVRLVFEHAKGVEKMAILFKVQPDMIGGHEMAISKQYLQLFDVKLWSHYYCSTIKSLSKKKGFIFYDLSANKWGLITSSSIIPRTKMISNENQPTIWFVKKGKKLLMTGTRVGEIFQVINQWSNCYRNLTRPSF